MSMLEFFNRRFTVMVGNYGSGKTEMSLNLALTSAENGSATLVDLDIVNPYFRSSSQQETLKAAGVRVLMPSFALSTVDIPALPPEIQSVFEVPCDRVIFDVGGDDTGAAALGRYAPSFRRFREQTQVVLVVNTMRPLTQTAEDIVELARRIEARGRLTVDAIVNNTNLSDMTDVDMIRRGEAIVREAAAMLGVTRIANAGMTEHLEGMEGYKVPMQRHMQPEWMVDA